MSTMATTKQTAAADRHLLSNGQGQGMNWLRKEKRLAIYLRDGLACCYCGEGVEQDAKLTLDHLTPHADGGSNDTTNLITACHRCNSARGSRPWRAFAKQVADYINHGATKEQIVKHITATAKRKIDVAVAKEIMARRGSFSAALDEARSR